MGSGGVPSGGVIEVHGRYGDLPYKNAKQNAKYKLYVRGKLVQTRQMDSKGRAKVNTDYAHQNAHGNHEFPHTHMWIWNGDNGTRL